MGKIIEGRETYLETVRFSAEDFANEDDQDQYTGGGSLEIIDDAVTEETPPEIEDQEAYSVSSYRTRLQEMRRPIFMRLKMNMRDMKNILRGGSMKEEDVSNLRRLFTDDVTSLLQEASEIAKAKGGRTVDLVLKLNSLGDKEITKAGRSLGLVLRKVNRIRDRMKFIPKRQQEELNAALSKLIGLIVDSVFDTNVNLKTYRGLENE